MSVPLTVIIAALNDQQSIAAAVDSAFAAGAAEVIVSDGGSSDETRAIAAHHGARILESPPDRSRQFNIGAQAAQHDALIFLHADTILPSGAAAAVAEALRRSDFGGFRVSFAESAARLRIAAFMINLRTRLTRCPWGDQAQFIRRSTFLESGGFREIPLMEDYELAARMKRSGRPVVLPLTVTTSGRRFLRKGVIRTAMINWFIVVRWHLGAEPETLARIYRS